VTKGLPLPALVALLVACSDSRVPARNTPDSVVTESAALPLAVDDDGCEADSAHVHPAPTALLTEYLERGGRGELLSTSPWHASAVECPGHTPGWDEATVVAGWQVTPLEQGTDTARYVVEFRRLARLTQDSVGPFIVAEPGLEHDTVIVVRKPYGWRIGGYEFDPHIRSAAARAQLRDSTRGAALLDSLATTQATFRAPGV
jgi:hypothetical protein